MKSTTPPPQSVPVVSQMCGQPSSLPTYLKIQIAHDIFPSHLLSKNVKYYNIQVYDFAFCILWVWNLVPHPERRF
jgi:hypothetical protein